MKFSTATVLAFAVTCVSAAPAEIGAEAVPEPIFNSRDTDWEEVADPVVAARALPTVPPVVLTTDQKKALDAHNLARSKHNEVPLVWDKTLQAKAQVWANYLASTNTFKHNTTGENLYMRYPPTTTDLLLASNAWIAELPLYHNEIIPQGNFSKYGHYTQVVWSTTQRVGMAQARDKTGKYSYVVARYDPVGNWVGKRPY